MSVGELLQGRYEPLAVAGRGGQGMVVRALDRRHDRTVAIKVHRLTSDAKRGAALAEARTLLSLDPHPNLPLVREDFFVEDDYCIAMDWIEGRSLMHLLREEGTPGLHPELAIEALEHAAAALDHLHHHDPPICHLDVKPANLIRRSDGRVVLVDLGLSGGTGAPYAGTPSYRAPELASVVEPRSAADVYALAVTAHELLSGDRPLPGRDPALDHLADGWAARIRRGLARALSTDPERRPRTAGEFVEMLRPMSAPTNLPAALTTFIGRAREIAETKELLRGTRCVTLTGAGGIGKTRVALAVAQEIQARAPEGIWFVELAGLGERAPIHESLTVALGARVEDGRSPLDRLVAHLGEGQQLLVLDNCEHIVDRVARLADELLRRCPRLRILATSREPLRIPGEQVSSVPPMQLPDDRLGARDAEATRLFIERARVANRTFSFGVDEIHLATTIVRRLEGIPLAIELAAGRLRDLSLAKIASGLDHSLELLAGGPRTLQRQETLRAAFDWSWDLLVDPERRLLARLSVFAGSFTRSAAVEVCGADLDGDVPGCLASLVERSLCLRDHGEDEARYRLLEPVRAYAAERLASSGEHEFVRERHLRYFEGIAAERADQGAEQAVWLRRLGRDLEDLRSAIAWAFDHAPGAVLNLVDGLQVFWEYRGLTSEGLRWTRRALDLFVEPTAERARALLAGARLAWREGLTEEARGFARGCTSLSRDLDDPIGEVVALNAMALADFDQDEVSRARVTLEEALRIAQSSRDEPRISMTLLNLCTVALTEGKRDESRALAGEALAIAKRLGNVQEAARAVSNLAILSGIDQDFDTSLEHLSEARELYTEIGDRPRVANADQQMALVLYKQGRLDEARSLYEKALREVRGSGPKRGTAAILINLGDLLQRLGETTAAASRFEEGVQICEEMGRSTWQAICLIGLARCAHSNADGDAARDAVCEAFALHRPDVNPNETEVILRRAASVIAGEDAVVATGLMGTAEALRDRFDLPIYPVERDSYDHLVADLRRRLGPEGFAPAWTDGWARSPTEAIDEALCAFRMRAG